MRGGGELKLVSTLSFFVSMLHFRIFSVAYLCPMFEDIVLFVHFYLL